MKWSLLKYTNWFSLLINTIICILAFSDKIKFGFGLGDLVYIFGIFIITAIQIRFIFSSQIKEDNYNKTWFKIISILFLSTTLYYFYILTIGKGTE